MSNVYTLTIEGITFEVVCEPNRSSWKFELDYRSAALVPGETVALLPTAEKYVVRAGECFSRLRYTKQACFDLEFLLVTVDLEVEGKDVPDTRTQIVVAQTVDFTIVDLEGEDWSGCDFPILLPNPEDTYLLSPDRIALDPIRWASLLDAKGVRYRVAKPRLPSFSTPTPDLA